MTSDIYESNLQGKDSFAITTRGLVKEYQNLSAVKGLDLSVPFGATFGLLGPNGAGKSSTIKVLMGLLNPTAGDVRVLGRDPRTESNVIRKKVGYVPERQHIYGWMTVHEVIRFTRTFYPTWDDDFQRELMRQYDLNPRTKVKALSSGMVTKLALLLALAHQPELLILDEPTTGLDPLIREEFLDGVLKLMDREQRTVFFSSHILSDIEKIADTVGIINDGKLLIHGSLKDLISNTKRLEVQLASSNGKRVLPDGTIWQKLEKDTWQITIHEFSSDSVEQVRQQNRVESLNVIDLDLEEIFKDFIRGARVEC